MGVLMRITFSKNKYIGILTYSVLLLSLITSYSGLEACLPQNPSAFWLLVVGWVCFVFVWLFRNNDSFLSLLCVYKGKEIDISIAVILAWGVLMDVRVIGIPLIRLVLFS